MTQNIDRQALAKKAHAAAVAKGFWDEDYSPEHYLMLVITELSEAVEAHRKGKHADIKNYADSAQTTFNFEHYIKDTLEDELADAYIRLMDFCGGWIESRGGECYLGDLEDDSDDTDLYDMPLESDRTFADIIYRVIALPIGIGYYNQAIDMIFLIEKVCNHLGIDLAWHIEEKMRYNETRPARHGKEY